MGSRPRIGQFGVFSIESNDQLLNRFFWGASTSLFHLRMTPGLTVLILSNFDDHVQSFYGPLDSSG